MINKLLNRVRKLAKHDNIYDLIASSAEELGEVSRAVLIEDGKKSKLKKLKESSYSEAVDLTICALAMFYKRGGTDEELLEIMDAKLDKWEDKDKAV